MQFIAEDGRWGKGWMLTADARQAIGVPMEQKNNAGAGGSFDPSSAQGERKADASWKALLPEDISQGSKMAARSAFAKAGMNGVGETSKVFAGAAPGASTRADAARVVREAKKAAVNHYSDPENLAELGVKLSVLMADYGEPLSRNLGAARFQEAKTGLEFGDDGEKAVYTKMMIDIYNGGVKNLRKAAAKTGDRSFLSDGEGGELSEAPVPEKLEKAYSKATERDRNYVWSLETDRDGHSRVVRKSAPTIRDWAGKTVDGMSSSATMEEGIGYLLGSSLRAAFRLIPGMGEVDGKGQLRAEAARLYQQVEALIPSRKGNIHPHGTAGERAADVGGISEAGGRGLIIPGFAFTPRMGGVKSGNREGRHAGHG